jgi:hypothetical protein
MTKSGKSLLRVVAVLLLVQWTAALEPCLSALARIGGAQAVELCSPGEAPRVILIGEDGKPVQPMAPHGGCLLCQVGGPAILPQAPVVPAATIAYAASRPAIIPAGLPPLPPRGPPQQPRAPPVA